MKIIKLCILTITLLAFTLPTLSYSFEDKYRDEIDKMLKLLNVDKVPAEVYSRLEYSLYEYFVSRGISEEQMPIFEKHKIKLSNLIKNEMKWEALRDDFIDVYAATYTAEEVSKINEFLSSPAGMKLIDKWPAMHQEVNRITGMEMDLILPKFDKILQEMREELVISNSNLTK